MENNYQIGIIKWYNKLKGYGVIITANNEEYFIHISNIKEIPDRILVATSFIFEKGFQNQKKTALNCRIPSTKEDFIVALNLVGQKRNVEIEVEVKYKGHRGNVYTRKEFKDYDILDYFLFKLLRNKPFEIVRDYFITGFNLINQQNDINKIIDYYKITKNRINAITLTEVPKDLIDEPDPSIDTTQLPEIFKTNRKN